MIFSSMNSFTAVKLYSLQKQIINHQSSAQRAITRRVKIVNLGSSKISVGKSPLFERGFRGVLNLKVVEMLLKPRFLALKTYYTPLNSPSRGNYTLLNP